MGRSNKTGGYSQTVSPEDVLARRVVPSAEELISLIREVNPTGRSLTKREAAQRYATKSKLQSLLIERFAADLAVESSEPGVVLLRHRYLGMAAGHTVVADLEEKARAWVQLQLDLGTGGDDATRPRHGDSGKQDRARVQTRDGEPAPSWDDLLAQGHRALEEYDFEAARAAFERAHDERPSEKGPVCALLDILVERLALDADALLLADSLDPDLLESVEVAAPLALAAARSGDRQRAERWAGGLEGEGAAAVHRTLAAAAIDSGELAYAAGALALARQYCPGDAESLSLEKRLAEAQALAVRSREATLAELAKLEDLSSAAALAREILAEHPGSAPARQVLKEAAARAREAEQIAVLTEIRSALAKGDSERGRALLLRAQQLGVNATQLKETKEAIEQIESTTKQASAEAEVEAVASRVVGAPESTDWQAALARYGSLDSGQRAQVRQRVNRKELGWFDELDEPAHPAKVIAAVMAISAAEVALSAGDPESAVASLAPHRMRLHDSKLGRALIASVDAAADEKRRDHAASVLSRAEEAATGGELAKAQSLLDSIRRADLPKSVDEKYEQLRRGIAAKKQRLEELESLARYLEADDWVHARQILEHLVRAGATPAEVEALKERLRDVEMRLRHTWVVLDHRPANLNARDAPELSWLNISRDGVALALAPGGRSAVFASTYGHLVFVRVVDVTSGQVERLVILRAPENLGYAAHGLAGNQFWIMGTDFQLLELSCDDWLPRRWCSLKGHAAADQRFEAGFSIPQAGTVWLRTSDPPPGWIQHAHVIDIGENRVLRTSSKDLDVRPIPGASPPLVLRTAFNEAAHIVGARGAPLADLAFPRDYRVLDVASHPSGEGFLALAFREDAEEDCIEVFASDRDGMRACASIPGVGEQPSGLATVRATESTYVTFHEREDGEMRLGRVRVQGNDVVVADQTSTNGDCILLQDEATTTAVALRMIANGVDLVPLGEAAPRFSGEQPEHLDIPAYEWPLSCAPNPDFDLTDRLYRGFAAAFYALPEGRRLEWAEKQSQDLAEKAAGLLALHDFLVTNHLQTVADKALQMAGNLHPNDPYVRLALVERSANEGLWDGEALWAETTVTEIREHLCHLQGLVLLRANQPEAAIAAWASSPSDGRCKIESLIKLARAVMDAQAHTSADLDHLPSLPGLIQLVFRSDTYLDAGDATGARSMLDRAWIRNLREVQTLARLAEAYLAAPADVESPHYFRAASLLAEFSEVGGRDFRFANRLWLGEHTWDKPRISSLVTRAKAWLNTQ